MPACKWVEIMSKKSLLKQLFIMFSLGLLVSCAGGPVDREQSESRRSDCISQSSIRGYTVLDESNLIVEGSIRRKYHVTLVRRAFGLRSTWAIGFTSTGNQVCAPFSEVVFDDGFRKESIGIAAIKELTPEDEEILLIDFGKKEPEIETTPAPAEVPGAEIEELDPAAND